MWFRYMVSLLYCFWNPDFSVHDVLNPWPVAFRNTRTPFETVASVPYVSQFLESMGWLLYHPVIYMQRMNMWNPSHIIERSAVLSIAPTILPATNVSNKQAWVNSQDNFHGNTLNVRFLIKQYILEKVGTFAVPDSVFPILKSQSKVLVHDGKFVSKHNLWHCTQQYS